MAKRKASAESGWRRRWDALRGKDVHDREELKRQELSVRAISRLTGYCRKTVCKYLAQAEGLPVYVRLASRSGNFRSFGAVKADECGMALLADDMEAREPAEE